MSAINTRDLIARLNAMPEVDRDAYLERQYMELDSVAAEFGLPRRFPLAAATTAADDRRPRREVWAPRLADHPHVAPMPEPVREEILHVVVSVETDAIERRLEHHEEAVGREYGSWTWDSTLATANRRSDLRQAPEAPDLGAILTAAEAELGRGLDDAIGLAVRSWIARQVEFLQMQGWTLAVKPATSGAGPSWDVDYERRHLRLSPDLHVPVAWKALTEPEVERLPHLTGRLILATAPEPAATAFPALAKAHVDDPQPARRTATETTEELDALDALNATEGLQR